MELTYTIIINQFFIGIPFSFVTYQLYRARFDWNDTNLEDVTTKVYMKIFHMMLKIIQQNISKNLFFIVSMFRNYHR